MLFGWQGLEQEIGVERKEIFDESILEEYDFGVWKEDLTSEIKPQENLEETKDKPKLSQNSEQLDPNKMEKKLRNRIRSRKARKRKKEYLEELETRVKYLEKENIRLLNLLNQNKSESQKDNPMNSKVPINEYDKVLRKVWSNVIDLETFDKKENPKPLADIWDDECWKLLEKHKSFVDSAIKMLINNIHGNSTPPYWKDLTEEYTTDYNIIKKLNSRTKYQIPEFMESHELNELDLFVASLNPTKNQFNFLRKVLFKKMFELKMKCQEAIKKLLDAKIIIQETYGEHFLIGGLFLAKSGIFKDEQIINSKIKETIIKKEDTLKEVWKVKSEPYTLTYKLSSDKIIGRAIKQHLSKENYRKNLDFNRFYINVT
ncbi:unnamed protein product [Moneuplotes crassus]|uniref:BZIP domain-containing protein n=1 Tax=Euplotes crassus TaxID=5936 RepID=A0AAD1X9C0_EUPCR|nr:unnamed protein product [Moneuplotes crassus]